MDTSLPARARPPTGRAHAAVNATVTVADRAQPPAPWPAAPWEPFVRPRTAIRPVHVLVPTAARTSFVPPAPWPAQFWRGSVDSTLYTLHELWPGSFSVSPTPPPPMNEQWNDSQNSFDVLLPLLQQQQQQPEWNNVMSFQVTHDVIVGVGAGGGRGGDTDPGGSLYDGGGSSTCVDEGSSSGCDAEKGDAVGSECQCDGWHRDWQSPESYAVSARLCEIPAGGDEMEHDLANGSEQLPPLSRTQSSPDLISAENTRTVASNEPMLFQAPAASTTSWMYPPSAADGAGAAALGLLDELVPSDLACTADLQPTLTGGSVGGAQEGRSYMCTATPCPKRFSRRHDLKRHLLVHGKRLAAVASGREEQADALVPLPATTMDVDIVMEAGSWLAPTGGALSQSPLSGESGTEAAAAAYDVDRLLQRDAAGRNVVERGGCVTQSAGATAAALVSSDSKPPKVLFTCAVRWCGHTFSKKAGLVRHAHTHTGERLYACGVCGRRFGRLDNCRTHESGHAAQCALGDGDHDAEVGDEGGAPTRMNNVF